MKHRAVAVCQYDLEGDDLCRDQREHCEKFTQGLGYSNLTGILEECGGLLVQLVTQRSMGKAARSYYIRENIC